MLNKKRMSIISFATIITLGTILVFSCWRSYFLGIGSQDFEEVVNTCMWCKTEVYFENGIVKIEDGIIRTVDVGNNKLLVRNSPEGFTCKHNQSVSLWGWVRKLPWDDSIVIESVDLIVPNSSSTDTACYVKPIKLAYE